MWPGVGDCGSPGELGSQRQAAGTDVLLEMERIAGAGKVQNCNQPVHYHIHSLSGLSSSSTLKNLHSREWITEYGVPYAQLENV